MNKKIESFLEEIHSLPDEKLDKQQLRSDLEMLLSSNPDISVDPEFKQKLQTRLDTIVEFKQWSHAVKKLSYLKVLLPIFACLVLVVWVFSMVDIKLFNWDTSNISSAQSEEEIIESIIPEQTAQVEIQQDPIASIVTPSEPLTVKQQILAKAAEKKAAKLQSPIASDTSTSTIETQDEVAEGSDSEVLKDIPSASAFSTQLAWTPPLDDTPEADLSIRADSDISSDEVNILESLLGPLGELEDTWTWSELAEDSEIAEGIFIQSCEAFEGQVETQSGSMLCVKDEVNICSRADYENAKCEYLE